jgi:23S rRNA (guanosine2251-2'-O)-methyltransferase
LFSGFTNRFCLFKLEDMRTRGFEARDNKHTQKSGGKSLSEDDLHAILDGVEVPFLLVLDCVQDPHNLGAILRTADGAGIHAVITPKDKSVGITETVERIAVGAAATVPFVRVTNLARTMKQLQEKRGLWFIGTSDAATQSLYQTDLTGPIGIVMGAEGKGMRRLTEEICDILVMIPMAGKVECLNVSVATGVCLYEAVRQRRVKMG